MDELYINLEKAFSGMPHRLNTAKLVRRMVMVRGKNGQVFRRMQWVRPWEASTGHGVRAIHNQQDYKEAKEHGVFEHPDTHTALAHQGIHNAEHLIQGMHHEHPVFLPETEQSARAAMKQYATNHIPQGYDQYTRHEHTNGIHYSHNDADVFPFDDDAVPQDYEPDNAERLHPVNSTHVETSKDKMVPNNWMDMTARQLAQHGVDNGYDEEKYLNKLKQAMTNQLGDHDNDMLAQVAEEMYYTSVGSRPTAQEPVKLPDTWHDMASFELSKYAKKHYPDRREEFANALELAKRQRSGGSLSSMDDLIMDMVRENLGLPPSPTSDDDDDLPTIGSTRGLATGDTLGQRIRNSTPEQAMNEFNEAEGRRARTDVLAMTVQTHGNKSDYQNAINQMRDALGKSDEDVADLSDTDLNGKERKVRAMARRRVPNPAKPSSKSISEQAKPLDINQIRADYTGPSLADLYNDKFDSGHKLTKQEEEAYHDLFNSLPISAIEHIMSHPNGDYQIRIKDTSVATNRSTPKVNIEFNIEDKNGGYMGHGTRHVHRLEDGTYHVHNDLLSVHKGKDNGIATHLYHRSEQMWKYLAGKGKRVEVSVFANISIGTYAWAGKEKGFDFHGTYERDTKRSELREFIKLNDWNEDDVMKSCGYSSVNDLNHAWQFAELSDGYTYDIGAHGFEDLSGKAHLGKAFMLTHAASWSGMKHINDDGSTDRQKHIDKLVNDHQWDTGNYSFDDDDDDEGLDDESSDGFDRGMDWFNRLPHDHQSRLMDELGARPSQLADYGANEWIGAREHYNNHIKPNMGDDK
jgi:hypothetical protein